MYKLTATDRVLIVAGFICPIIITLLVSTLMAPNTLCSWALCFIILTIVMVVTYYIEMWILITIVDRTR